MVQAAPHTAELDEYLKVVVQSVQAACGAAIPHLNDDPQAVERALKDCQELLGTVMAGKVEEWLD